MDRIEGYTPKPEHFTVDDDGFATLDFAAVPAVALPPNKDPLEWVERARVGIQNAVDSEMHLRFLEALAVGSGNLRSHTEPVEVDLSSLSAEEQERYELTNGAYRACLDFLSNYVLMDATDSWEEVVDDLADEATGAGLRFAAQS